MLSPTLTRPSLSRLVSVSTSRSLHTSQSLCKIYKDVSKQQFESLLSASKSQNRILVVDFHADWCGPCKTLGPILEREVENPSLVKKKSMEYDLATVDTDSEDGMALSASYGVRALPTVVAFKSGQQANKFVGAVQPAGVRNFLESL